jgi:hypothetical protein
MSRYSKSALNRRRRRRKADENTANRSVEVQTKLDFLKERATFPEKVKVEPIGRRKDKTAYLQRREAWFAMMREKRNAEASAVPDQGMQHQVPYPAIRGVHRVSVHY